MITKRTRICVAYLMITIMIMLSSCAKQGRVSPGALSYEKPKQSADCAVKWVDESGKLSITIDTVDGLKDHRANFSGEYIALNEKCYVLFSFGQPNYSEEIQVHTSVYNSNQTESYGGLFTGEDVSDIENNVLKIKITETFENDENTRDFLYDDFNYNTGDTIVFHPM